jgi:heptosyltransferase-1
VLIHPGGGWGAKRWPTERYGAVVEELAVRGAIVLVNAGPGEEELAGAVVAAAHGQGTVLECTLEQLMALTKRVSLVIGGDTGPVHLACASGKPVVGIYGPTDPKRNGPYAGRDGRRVRVLRNPESRRNHSRYEQPEAGLLTIEPEAVMEAVMSLMLEERQSRQSRQNSDAGWERA